MALADAKLTGRPGVVFVSRGPGACNVSIAIHSAQQDANPLVVFVGQVERANRYRRAFQEVDYAKTFSDMAKWTCEVEDPDRIAELTAMAYHIASAGTPGPVVVSLPEDVLEAESSSASIVPKPMTPAPAALEQIEAAAKLLDGAARPLLIAGGNLRTQRGRSALLAASEKWSLPVAVTNKHQDIFPNRHRHWAGHLGYAAAKPLMTALREADLILAVGTRLGDVPTQSYTFPHAPAPEQPLIHVYPDPLEIGRVFAPALGIVADGTAFLEALAAAAPARSAERSVWTGRLNAVVRNLMRWTPQQAADGIVFGTIVDALARALPRDAVITLDSGNFVSWVHRHFPFETSQTLIGAVSGAMGLGVPAAVSAALRHPERQAVALVGDGGFLMTGNELATAVRHRARVRVFVANNSSYGTIRTHQEMAYPGRVSATDLTNPDFARLAEAFGARGLRVDAAEQVEGAVAEALATPGPVLVDVKTSLEHISANATIARLRAR